MGYEVAAAALHHVKMEDRRGLTVSGVEGVERFEDSNIVVSITLGLLVVSVERLTIDKLSVGGGDLKVEGKIDALSYEERAERNVGGFFSRLLR